MRESVLPRSRERESHSVEDNSSWTFFEVIVKEEEEERSFWNNFFSSSKAFRRPSRGVQTFGAIKKQNRAADQKV